MRVYVAAPFVERGMARLVKRELEKAGHTVTSRWIETHLDESVLDDLDKSRGEAETDLDDIEAADVLVLVDYNFQCSTGRAFEFGYAVARGKTVIRIGPPRRHIFNALVSVLNVSGIVEAIDVLNGMETVPGRSAYRGV